MLDIAGVIRKNLLPPRFYYYYPPFRPRATTTATGLPRLALFIYMKSLLYILSRRESLVKVHAYRRTATEDAPTATFLSVRVHDARGGRVSENDCEGCTSGFFVFYFGFLFNRPSLLPSLSCKVYTDTGTCSVNMSLISFCF